MSTAADLLLAVGVDRRLFLKIDGLEPILWEHHDRALPATGYTRSGIACLSVGSEFSSGLDMSRMRVDLSAMTFTLDGNIDASGNRTPTANDANATYYFAKLFAPGRWSRADEHHTWVARDGSSQLDANATSIKCVHDPDARGFAAGGTAYVGRETFSYTAIDSGNKKFTGVSKGLYPAVGTTSYGYTYSLRVDDSQVSGSIGSKLLVSSVPYSWLGRRVALYVTTWDNATGEWNSETDARLLWVGSISEGIGYNRSTGQWEVSCASIFADLEREICVDLPRANLRGINLCSVYAHEFLIEEYRITATPALVLVASYRPTLTAQWYRDANHLRNIFHGMISGFLGGCTAEAGETPTARLDVADCGENGGWRIRFKSDGSTTNRFVRITYLSKDGPYRHHHPLRALGFSSSFVTLEIDQNETIAVVEGDKPFESYHPLHPMANGSRLYTDYDPPLWSSQGDHGSSRAFCVVRDEERAELAAYTAQTDEGTERVTYLTLDVRDTSGISTNGAIGHRRGEAGATIEQSYSPMTEDASTFEKRGPFELMLYSLVSTGTTSYNHMRYDKLPLQCGLAIPVSLVDVQSFLDADWRAKGYQLAFWRKRYAITESISWIDLFCREAQLFGEALVLRDGKLAVRPMFAHDFDRWTLTLSDSSGCVPIETGVALQSRDNVVTSLEVQWLRRLLDGEYLRTTTFVDSTAEAEMAMRQTMSVEHPGLGLDLEPLDIAIHGEINRMFDAGRDMLRTPQYQVGVTLAPTMANRAFVGDVVRFTQSNFPDPLGGGSMSANCYAMIRDVRWSYGEKDRWTGSADLIVFSRYAIDAQIPWGPAALVDLSVANGGWNAAAYHLTLVPWRWGYQDTDSQDGAAFSEDDEVLVIERHPADPTSGVVHGPYTVSSYSTSTYRLTLKNTPTIGTWDSTQEHAVVFANWDAIVTAQQTRGAWLATSASGLLGTDQAQRYG